MKFFSGFCIEISKNFFSEYIEDKEFVVAGFSYGAQKAVNYVLNSSKRINKLQLLSPAFFDYNEKLINLNINAFKRDKNSYIKNFLTKAGINKWKMENGKWKIGEKGIEIKRCNEEDLVKLFTFNWEKIKEIKDIEIEVFLGECDRIIALKKAYDFFKNYADVYFIKKANHFLKENSCSGK